MLVYTDTLYTEKINLDGFLLQGDVATGYNDNKINQ